MRYFLGIGLVLIWLVGCGVNAGQENSLRIETPEATPERTRPYETPTPLADDPEVAELLGSWCDTGCAEAVVDYIRSHPDSPYGEKLIEHLFEIHWSRMQLGDFVRELLTERMVAPLNKNGRVPEDFLGWLAQNDYGTLLRTDLDGDGVQDYLVEMRWGPEEAPSMMNGGLFWVYGADGAYSVIQIPTDVRWEKLSRRPQALQVRDMNGDGRDDVVFMIPDCGNGCFTVLHVVMWNGTALQDAWEAADWAVYGEYAFTDLPDGTVEVVATVQEGPTLGSGPRHTFAVHFRFVGNGFVPVALSSAVPRGEWDKFGKPMMFALQLVNAYQFQDAVYVYDRMEDDLQVSPRGVDMRPYFLYHKGMALWLMGDSVGAGEAWDALRGEYPDTVISRDVEKYRGLVGEPDGIWKFCDALRGQNADWKPQRFSWFMANEVGLRVIGWRAECETRFLLPMERLTRVGLKGELERLGLGWEVFAEDFDLNGDGVKDLIGVVSQGDERRAWAFLSEGAEVRALYVRKELPVGVLDLKFVVGYPQEWKFERMTVTDADGNGMPEILLEQTGIRWLGRWDGERFVSEGE